MPEKGHATGLSKEGGFAGGAGGRRSSRGDLAGPAPAADDGSTGELGVGPGVNLAREMAEGLGAAGTACGSSGKGTGGHRRAKRRRGGRGRSGRGVGERVQQLLLLPAARSRRRRSCRGAAGGGKPARGPGAGDGTMGDDRRRRRGGTFIYLQLNITTLE